jgi:hypothetical protein
VLAAKVRTNRTTTTARLHACPHGLKPLPTARWYSNAEANTIAQLLLHRLLLRATAVIHHIELLDGCCITVLQFQYNRILYSAVVT